MSASLAVQRLLVAALTEIDGVTGVFDGPAPDAPPPYLTVGADVVTDAGHKSGRGHEHRVFVTAWAEGPAAAPVKALLGVVEARALALAGATDGHRIVGVQLVRSQMLPASGGWRQGVTELRVRSEAVAEP